MRISFLLAALAALVAIHDASSATIRITRFGGAVEAGVELAHQQSSTPVSDKRKLDRYRFDEALELGFDGYVLTSEFLNFHLGARIGFRQELFDGSNGNGQIFTTLPSYDATLNVFPSKPLALLLFANRYQDDMIQSFGTDSESLSESFGGTFRLRNRWFPSTLTAQQLTSVATSKGGIFVSRRAEQRRLLEYNGEHISAATNVNLKLRAEDVDDESIPPVGDYQTYLGNFRLGHRWGPYFEKFWRVSASHFWRQGSFQFANTSVATAFFWDPTDLLKTQYSYHFKDFDSNGQQNQTHSAQMVFRHQLYDSLSSNMNILFDHREQGIGTLDSGGVTGLLNYRRNLPWGSVLLIEAGGQYQIENRDFISRGAVVSGENLPIAKEIGNFLSNPRVDTSAIQVFETLGGAVLIEGIDYTVDVVSDRTSIDRVSTGSIEIGDVVFVNYTYEADPSGLISRSGTRFGVGWDFGWGSIGYVHDQTRSTLHEGDPQPLQRSRRDSIRLDLNGTWGTLNGSLGALLGREKTRTVDFDELAFQQELTWKPLRRFHLNLNLRESYQDFRVPDREQLTITAGLTAQWQIRPRWGLRGFGDFRYVENSAAPTQQDAGLGLRVDLNLGKIEIMPTVIWWRRQRGGSVTNDLRGVLRLRRRF